MPSPRLLRVLIYAHNISLMSRFYQAFLNATVLHSDADHAALQADNFKVFIERWPQNTVRSDTLYNAICLLVSVESIPCIRPVIEKNGGQLDPAPPMWVAEKQSICSGLDPEGNPFRLFEE